MRSLLGLSFALTVAAGLLAAAGDARAQPCITCRTEDCPDKAGAAGWCGRGHDPHAGGTTGDTKKRPHQAGVACPSGKLASRDTQGHCCWPGQAWSGARKECVGEPTSCPSGTVAQGSDCVAEAHEPPPAPAKKEEPAAQPARHEEQLPAQLSRDDVVRGMSAIAGAVRQCYLTFQIFGTCTVEAVVEPSGRVRSARATGRFADNSEGGCVAEAVQRALFHPFRGPAQTVSFPFQMQ